MTWLFLAPPQPGAFWQYRGAAGGKGVCSIIAKEESNKPFSFCHGSKLIVCSNPVARELEFVTQHRIVAC